jgi:DNA-directed RNA polymerase specialized sigma24 family protein
VSDEVPPRPSAGRPPTLGHYQRILAEYEQLKREGHAAPINVLVERYGVKKDTVKSWLHRARKYLTEKESDS